MGQGPSRAMTTVHRVAQWSGEASCDCADGWPAGLVAIRMSFARAENCPPALLANRARQACATVSSHDCPVRSPPIAHAVAPSHPPSPPPPVCPGLDAVLRGVARGDNIVWQIQSLDDYRALVQPYAARGAARSSGG